MSRASQAVVSERQERLRLDQAIANLAVLHDKYNTLREQESSSEDLSRSLSVHKLSDGLQAEEGLVFADSFAKYDKKIARLKAELAKARKGQSSQSKGLWTNLEKVKLQDEQKLAEMRTDESVKLEHAQRDASRAVKEAIFEQKRRDMSKLLESVRRMRRDYMPNISAPLTHFMCISVTSGHGHA